MRVFIIILMTLIPLFSTAQIQSGSLEPEKEQEEKKKNKKEEKTVIIDGEEYVVTKKKEKKEKEPKGPLPTTGRFIYASSGPMWSNSFFKPEFEGQYELRKTEKAGWGFTSEAGMKVNVKHFLQFSVGFGYAQYQQKYDYVKPDSITFDTAYSHVRKHQQITVPLRIQFIHGKGNFKFYHGFGVFPSMQLNQILIAGYTTSEGGVEEGVKTVNRNFLQTFQIGFGAHLGMEYHFTDHLSAFISPEFRFTLSNTNINLRHSNKLYGVTLRVGLQFQL